MMRSRLGFVPNRLMLALVPRLGLPSELGMAKETSPVYLIQHFKVDNSTAECQSPIVPKIDCPSIDALEFSPPDYLTVKKKSQKTVGYERSLGRSLPGADQRWEMFLLVQCHE